MAPRKVAKQPAAETVVAADSNVTSSRKRKLTPPKKRILNTKKSKPVRTGSRSAKSGKRNDDEVTDEMSVISPKKLRGKTKNTVEMPKSTITKSKTRLNKQAEVAVNNNVDEKVTEQQEITEEQVVEKKARGKPTTKKAGTPKKPTAAKSRAKKPKDEAAVENSAEDSEKGNTGEENFVKKPRLRREKTVEESDVPAAASKAKPALKSRKRKNPEDANGAVTEAEDAQVAKKDEKTETIANKKIRNKSKKVETETSDAPKMKPKGRTTKNSAKVETAEPEEVKVKKQNDQSVEIQEDNSKAKNAKTKKGNAKKTTSKPKRNAAEEKTNDTPVEEAAMIEMLETDVKENGDIDTIQMTEPKQKKKKNTGKTNAVTNEKTVTKGRQKKGQTAATDEEEATKDKIAVKINLSSEASDEKNVFNQNDSLQENDKDDKNKLSIIKGSIIDETDKLDCSLAEVDTSVKETSVDTSFLLFK